MSPKNGGLEDDPFLSLDGFLAGAMLVLGRVNFFL